MDNADEIRSAIAQGLTMPNEAPTFDLLSRAVLAADELGEKALAVDARLALVRAYVFSAEAEKALAPFAWCLHTLRTTPEVVPDHSVASILWYFKSAVTIAAASPRVSAEQVHALEQDMEREYRAQGKSMHAVHGTRVRSARHLGEEERRERELVAWRAAPRDDRSDCEACDPEREIQWFIDQGQDEAALAVASPILTGQLGCKEQPARVQALVAASMERLGRREEAWRTHVAAYRRHRAQERHIGQIGDHLTYLVVSGRLRRGLAVLRAHGSWTNRIFQVAHLLAFLAPATALLESLVEAGAGEELLGVDLPAHEVFSPGHEVGAGSTIAEAAEALRRWACVIAADFDRRNGNTVVSSRIGRTMSTRPLDPDRGEDTVEFFEVPAAPAPPGNGSANAPSSPASPGSHGPRLPWSGSARPVAPTHPKDLAEAIAERSFHALRADRDRAGAGWDAMVELLDQDVPSEVAVDAHACAVNAFHALADATSAEGHLQAMRDLVDMESTDPATLFDRVQLFMAEATLAPSGDQDAWPPLVATAVDLVRQLRTRLDQYCAEQELREIALASVLLTWPPTQWRDETLAAEAIALCEDATRALVAVAGDPDRLHEARALTGVEMVRAVMGDVLGACQRLDALLMSFETVPMSVFLGANRALANISASHGFKEEAIHSLREIVNLYGAAGRVPFVLADMQLLVRLLANSGRTMEAAEVLETCLEHCRGPRYAELRLRLRTSLLTLFVELEEDESLLPLALECARARGERGETETQQYCLEKAGAAARGLGDFDQASELMQQCAALEQGEDLRSQFTRERYLLSAAMDLSSQPTLHLARERLDRIRDLLDQAEGLVRKMEVEQGSDFSPLWELSHVEATRSQCLLACGEEDEGLARAERALAGFRETGDADRELRILLVAARVLLLGRERPGAREDARRLLEEAAPILVRWSEDADVCCEHERLTQILERGRP
ncbi:hypothetical protein I6B53_09270 [Schaalia sp. 19OD2882]|uniref:hypothetical protein n=1 Tax=Schaalia sp. 19OD2882 TaxID=2794089 RepID=UPI001C1E9906|nr:hypothetical protein [Schaalia sp. 19OD2882]QWW19278.1 hypothetical protein I6B53_09270 [Schaalia sp. 19OD2882]